MQQVVEQPRLVQIDPPSYKEAWAMVTSQLRMEMTRGAYESWVQALQPLSFKEGVFRLGAVNNYTIEWVQDHLGKTLSGLLESVLNQPVRISFTLNHAADRNQAEEAAPAPLALVETTVPAEAPPTNGTAKPAAPSKTERGKKKPAPSELDPDESGSPRKIQLQRAYGTERARVIQPERGMFLTMYFFNNWLPLLGHSALTTVLAARSMCYWNPMTGELRNLIETDMSELARRADVSVRTVKDVLNHPLVKKYFLRYKVRRIMTTNGVRTAGILLQVRMDDPLTPEDQETHSLTEEERWYNADFEDEQEDD